MDMPSLARGLLERCLLELQRLTNFGEVYVLATILGWSAARLRGHGFTLRELTDELARLSKND